MPLNKIDASWKRRQDYLIRSLFQDLPPFSPVPEENESADSSYLRNQPPSVAPESSYRSPSPLPPLIIEVEPNRHDEPEEFYKKLEKRVLKYYRKLFIEDQSNVTMNDTTDEDMVDSETGTANLKRPRSISQTDDDLDEDAAEASANIEANEKSGGQKGATSQNDAIISNERTSRNKIVTDSNNITKSNSNVLPRSSSNEDGDRNTLSSSVPDGADAEEISAGTCETPTTEHSMDYRLVTFQADVHREAADDMVPPPSVVCELLTEETDADIHIGSDSQDLLENRYVPENIDIIPEVDVMRTPQIRASAGSLHNAANSFSPENMSPRSMEEPSLRAHTEPSSSDDRESNVEEEDRESVSKDFDLDFDALHRTSTPIDRINVLEGRVVNEHSRTRKRSSSSSSSSNSIKKPRYEEAGTQTSVDRDNRSNFPYIFVGRTISYNICTCADHVCASTRR